MGSGVMAVIPISRPQRMPIVDGETEEDKLITLKATPRDPSCRTRIFFNSDIYRGKYSSLGRHYRSLETLPHRHLACYQEDRRKWKTKKIFYLCAALDKEAMGQVQDDGGRPEFTLGRGK